jgi:hypothetical protein
MYLDVPQILRFIPGIKGAKMLPTKIEVSARLLCRG